MAIDGVSGVYGSQGSFAVKQSTVEDLQDQFLRILLTQLRYQDPMEPMKEHEFLAQMAQFSSATQIGELNQTVQATLRYLMAAQANQSLLSAANLIGKTFIAALDGEFMEGVVESVCFHNGNLMVKSGLYLIPIDSLVYVGPEPQPPAVDPAETASLEEVAAEGQVEVDATQGN